MSNGLRELIEGVGLSRSEFARLACISDRLVYLWLNGQGELTPRSKAQAMQLRRLVPLIRAGLRELLLPVPTDIKYGRKRWDYISSVMRDLAARHQVPIHIPEYPTASTLRRKAKTASRTGKYEPT